MPQTSFVLADGQDELRIPLTFTSKDGSVFIKTFVLKRNDYAIGVDYHVNNASAAPLELTLFGQLKQSINLPKSVIPVAITLRYRLIVVRLTF